MLFRTIVLNKIEIPMNRLLSCFAFLSLIFLLSFLQACSQQKISSFDKTAPTFSLFEFFEGESLAYGIFEDRFGNLRRRFKVNISGKRSEQSIEGKDAEKITLIEDFIYEDGEKQRRIWTIKKEFSESGLASYEGEAEDVIGIAKGSETGSAFFWQYDVDLKISENNLRVKFSDWIYQMDDYIAINKATVSKFGVEIGTVTLVFVRGEPASLIGPFNITVW